VEKGRVRHARVIVAGIQEAMEGPLNRKHWIPAPGFAEGKPRSRGDDTMIGMTVTFIRPSATLSRLVLGEGLGMRAGKYKTP